LIDYCSWAQSKEPNKSRHKVLTLKLDNLQLVIDHPETCIEAAAVSIQWFNSANDQHSVLRSTPSVNALNIKIADKVKVEFRGVTLPDYDHQIAIRVFDYLQIQLKEVMFSPFTFNEYFARNGTVSQEIHTRMFRLKTNIENKMIESEIWKTIKTPSNLELNIYDIGAEIGDLGLLTFEQISITESSVSSYNPSIKSDIICDQLSVKFKGGNIRLTFSKEEDK
jgi:hypothetical protein